MLSISLRTVPFYHRSAAISSAQPRQSTGSAAKSRGLTVRTDVHIFALSADGGWRKGATHMTTWAKAAKNYQIKDCPTCFGEGTGAFASGAMVMA
jgi:hypothetical protein